MPDKIITLPSKEEMLQRLLKVNDSNNLRQYFYPKLLKEAGSEIVAIGVVMMLQLAIFDYTKDGLPELINVMNALTPDFIDALCPDEEVAKEAKVLFEQAMAAE